MNEQEYKLLQLQRIADELFVYCLQFTVGRDRALLQKISSLSHVLHEEGYDTSFQHKRRVLILRSQLAQLSSDLSATQLDLVLPRQEDLKGLPDEPDNLF